MRPERSCDLRRHRDRDVEPGLVRAGVAGDVINITNQSTHDYAYSITSSSSSASQRFEGQIAYTYSHSYDVWDLTSPHRLSNWQLGLPSGPRRRSGAGAVEMDAAPLSSRPVHALTKTGISMTWIRRVRRCSSTSTAAT